MYNNPFSDGAGWKFWLLYAVILAVAAWIGANHLIG